MATRRGASIGLTIALTLIVGGALVWNRIYRLPDRSGRALPESGALLVIEHGGVPPQRSVVQRPARPNLPVRRDRAGKSEERRADVAAPKEHVVRDGESLSSIARRFYRRSSRWPEIARANGLREPYVIQVGQTLTIP